MLNFPQNHECTLAFTLNHTKTCGGKMGQKRAPVDCVLPPSVVQECNMAVSGRFSRGVLKHFFKISSNSLCKRCLHNSARRPLHHGSPRIYFSRLFLSEFQVKSDVIVCCVNNLQSHDQSWPQNSSARNHFSARPCSYQTTPPCIELDVD